MNILTPKLDQQIGHQIKQISQSLRKKIKSRLPNITISREFGCEGYPLAIALKSKLDNDNATWNLFSRDLLKTITDEQELSKELESALPLTERNILTQDLEYLLHSKPNDFAKYKEMAKNFKLVTEPGGAIVVGAAGAILSQDNKNFFHIRLTASLPYRVNRVADILNISKEEAKKIVTEKGENRRDFIRKFTNQDISNPSFYDLTINNDRFNAEQITEIVLHAMKLRKLL